MTYFYPNNLASKTLFAKYWTGRDLGIIFGLFVLAMLFVVVFHSPWLFIILFTYALFSAKITNGYSLTRLGVLYTRYLLTDILIYHWR